jgi:hypothetical protein
MGATQVIEDEPGLELQKTEQICSDCGNELVYTEEIWRITMVTPQMHEGEAHYYPVIDESNTEGDFLYEPHYFCFSCWEKLFTELEADVQEAVDDIRVEDPHNSHFTCDCCESGIREWEVAGLFALGEFHRSARAPNNVRGECFRMNGPTPRLLCLPCVATLNEHHIELWEELENIEGCTDCIYERCTRREGCSCECHEEQEDGE